MPISPEHRALIDLPQTFARLATIMHDGSPQVTVMSFRRDGDTLRMTCAPDAVKARNIRRDPRVAVVVEHPRDPGHYVQMRGRAEVVDDPDVGHTELVAQAERYLGERADEYLAAVAAETTVTIVIYPEKFSEYRDDLSAQFFEVS